MRAAATRRATSAACTTSTACWRRASRIEPWSVAAGLVARRVDADDAVADDAVGADRRLEPQAVVGRVAPRPHLAAAALAAHLARPAERAQQLVARHPRRSA